ncbi:MAG: hypothetical protein AAGF78_00605 [Pseudomonadota bacterium]
MTRVGVTLAAAWGVLLALPLAGAGTPDKAAIPSEASKAGERRERRPLRGVVLLDCGLTSELCAKLAEALRQEFGGHVVRNAAWGTFDQISDSDADALAVRVRREGTHHILIELRGPYEGAAMFESLDLKDLRLNEAQIPSYLASRLRLAVGTAGPVANKKL